LFFILITLEISVMLRNLIFVFLLLNSLTLNAQKQFQIITGTGKDVDMSFEKDQKNKLFQLYLLKCESSPDLISGRVFYPYYSRSESKPILYYGKKHSSLITSKGRTYKDFTLNYDTFRDQVICGPFVFEADNAFDLELSKEYIDGFQLCFTDDTISFRYLRKGEISNFNLDEGFFEVVYDGKSKYLIKHKSTEYISNSISEYEYAPVGYINTGNGFSKITKSKQFLKLFGTRSAEVKRFIKYSGIRIHRLNKTQIVSVLKFYDNLKP
jgi:hypothetical protein